MHYFERKRNEKTYKEIIKMSAKLQEVIRLHLELLWGCVTYRLMQLILSSLESY